MYAALKVTFDEYDNPSFGRFTYFTSHSLVTSETELATIYNSILSFANSNVQEISSLYQQNWKPYEGDLWIFFCCSKKNAYENNTAYNDGCTVRMLPLTNNINEGF